MPERHVPKAFWTRLRLAPKALLLLDYDGTLAPFRKERENALPAPGVREALAELAGTGTRLAIVSGRPALEVLDLLAPAHPLEIWGCHGAEFLDDEGRLHLPHLAPEQDRLLRMAGEYAAGLMGRSLIEAKTTSVAAHGRPLPPEEWGTLREELRKGWDRLARREIAEIRGFEAGLEFRLAGWDKGQVVRSYLADHEETDVVAFAGDDDTDEDGFRALAGLGLAIRVRETRGETSATILLGGTADLVAFMRRWAGERRHRQT